MICFGKCFCEAYRFDNVFRSAILGLTDQHIHCRVNQVNYDDKVLEIKHEVSQKNNLDEPLLLDDGETPENQIVLSKIGSISFHAAEYTFMLYRHWNLAESLYHTPYIASRLGVWKDQGRRKLQTFFAKMGIPLKECNVAFNVMRVDCRNKLSSKLEEFSEDFGLDPEQLIFPSFRRVSVFLEDP
jgi:cell division control protein 45